MVNTANIPLPQSNNISSRAVHWVALLWFVLNGVVVSSFAFILEFYDYTGCLQTVLNPLSQAMVWLSGIHIDAWQCGYVALWRQLYRAFHIYTLMPAPPQ